ncbi:Uncharacterised protein [Mycobacteroides abscessus subsp. bolletii]|nr:Uncharacterised protein [Mycobacteroides abscessus subsp. bolletii]SHX55741.1 Uncharacterised protein [Mycobacteroides abscessus subsp. bolletii]SHX99523.1 Uncharacterised protein [Mycobacteroides abscessus subsp. bolletii]SHY61024.1 Uncharacterised protein [Mycobacteroides abscessus subsp. bolletii]SKS00211.1 Uncharacterised protein [Mycobacteroides abscessus subsp. bolletii]
MKFSHHLTRRTAGAACALGAAAVITAPAASAAPDCSQERLSDTVFDHDRGARLSR